MFQCSHHVPRLRHSPSHSKAFRDLSLPSGTRLYVPEPSSMYRNLSPLMDTLLYPFPDSSTSNHVLTMSPAVNAHSRSRHLLRPSSEHLRRPSVSPGSHRDIVCISFLYSFRFLPFLLTHSVSFITSFPVPCTWHLVYIRSHLQRDPHPFLFGSPARFVISCIRLLVP